MNNPQPPPPVVLEGDFGADGGYRDGRLKELIVGYFSNGCEGADWLEWNCWECVHNEETKPYCPIWILHLDKNYEWCNEPYGRKILNLFIPQDERGANMQCAMFIRKEQA